MTGADDASQVNASVSVAASAAAWSSKAASADDGAGEHLQHPPARPSMLSSIAANIAVPSTT